MDEYLHQSRILFPSPSQPILPFRNLVVLISPHLISSQLDGGGGLELECTFADVMIGVPRDSM